MLSKKKKKKKKKQTLKTLSENFLKNTIYTRKKPLGRLLVNSSTIPTWNQDTYQNWKDLNKLCRHGPAVRVFANGPGDLSSIPGRVIPKTLKMVLDTTLLNTQHYKVRFKGKVEQSWEWSSALPYTLV